MGPSIHLSLDCFYLVVDAFRKAIRVRICDGVLDCVYILLKIYGKGGYVMKAGLAELIYPFVQCVRRLPAHYLTERQAGISQHAQDG